MMMEELVTDMQVESKEKFFSKISQKIKSILVSEINLTIQEQSIGSIITKLLASPGTRIIVDPVTNIYYLYDEKLSCYIKLTCSDITIVNSVGSTVHTCREKFRSYLCNMVDGVVLGTVKSIEQKIDSRIGGFLKEVESEIKGSI